MATLALGMVKESLDTFVHKDSTAARAIIPRDKEVDALNKAINNDLADYMSANSDTVKRCLHLITASKSLERIADHATNIAEEVVYLYEGRDIRHTGKGKARPANGGSPN